MGAKTVTLEWVHIDEHYPADNFGYLGYAVVTFCLEHSKRIITLLQGQLPADLPESFTVTNARIELDRGGGSADGSALLKWLYRGLNKTGSTWLLQNKTTGKTWLSGGPFNIGVDTGELYWSGTLVNIPLQTLIGTAALNNKIEALGAGGWFLAALYAVNKMDPWQNVASGARLKFDWVETGTPTLTSFSPTSILSGATPVLYVYGNYLDQGSLDKIQLVGGSTYDLTSIVRDSASQLHGTIPGGVAIGSYTVRARIGGVNYDAPGSFAVSAAPVLTSFSPASILGSETPVLYVYGSALDGGSLDKIQLVGASTYDLTSIVRDSASQLHGTVPGGVAVGSYTVRARIAAVNYDAPGSFVVSATPPTLSNCRGDDGGKDFVKHFMRKVTCIGTYLGGTSSITLLGQEGQDDVSLTSITNVSATEVSGWLAGPIPPGEYQVRVVCTNGTAYRDIDVTLGPAWW